jgi:CBS domain containing-hemolysin-like protein
VATESTITAAGLALHLAGIGGLVLVTAFFVAADFALVAVRRTRIEELAATGDGAARAVQRADAPLDRYVAATQVGITAASLGVGWLTADLSWGAIRSAGALPGTIRGVATLAGAFLVAMAVDVLVGHLAARDLALSAPERTARLTVRPLMAFAFLIRPLTAGLSGAARRLLGLVGVAAPAVRSRAHSVEELRRMVVQSHAHGVLDESDRAMLAGVFDFHAKRVRDVMRPRTEIVAIPLSAGEDEVWATLREERYSRYPVFGESLDDVIGVLLAKDLWLKPADVAFDLRALVRQPLYVPDIRAAVRVLDDLRRTRAHMAVVLDEYGGTAGIVTLEDLVEEVVGDINDEYDMALRDAVEVNGILELSGAISLVDVRSNHHLPIPDGDWSTLGGYVFARLGRVPRVGDRAPYPGGELEVVAVNGRRVAAVRVHRRPAGGDEGATGVRHAPETERAR